MKRRNREQIFTNLSIKPSHWLKALNSNGRVKWTNVKKETGEIVLGFDGGYIVSNCDPLTGLSDKSLIGYAGDTRIVGSNDFRKSISGYFKRYGKFNETKSIVRRDK
jgi:hypothetical protein